MTHEVVFRKEAEHDITKLAVYTAEQSGLMVANRYADRILAACMALTHFPNRGRRRDDVLPGLRTIAFERRVTTA